jgi:adenylosuccinate lyase
MVKVWSDQTKFKIWYEIEAYACEAQAKLGVIPQETVESVWSLKDHIFDTEKINLIEKTTKHDVIAFLTYLSEFIGEHSRFVHQGMTSSDILDTCLNIQLVKASDILINDMDELLAVLKEKAIKHKQTLCIGRSHAVHAEPMTFGLKMAQAYAEMERNRVRLISARTEICVGAISGAVGTYANIEPSIEEYVCNALGLKPETVSTQIIPRDRHAMFFATLGVIGASIDRIATEIRHLQRTEVLEVEEYFSKGQKGSSAMPHKRNPVLTENLSGLSRLVRMSVAPAMENVVLWHERDISHSSVERNIAPDTTITLDFALHRLKGVIENLVVYPENMNNNLNKFNGLIHSQRVLLALTQKGISRENSYEIVQSNAMKVWNDGADFFNELKNDSRVSEVLTIEELEENFDLSYHLKHVDTIFTRVFGKI